MTALSIWLPGFLMKRDNAARLTTVNEVPAEFTSAPPDSIIKNASRQLTKEQKIQLITGEWESLVEETDEDFCNLNSFGIKTIVQNRVDYLNTKGIYPITISSDYGDWYSWSATPYRALDTTFETYAAIFWDVSFTKYDNTEYHRFIATESGDILYAEANITPDHVATETDITITTNDYTIDIISDFDPNLVNSSYHCCCRYFRYCNERTHICLKSQ